MADTSASITSTQYSGVHANMQSIARLLCIRKSNPKQDNEGKVVAQLCCKQHSQGDWGHQWNYLTARKREGSVSFTKGDGSHLSGGKKGLPHFTCSVYSYSFSSSPAFVFHFCIVTKTRTYLSKGWLNIGLGGGQEKLRSFLTSPTGIINTKLAD